MKGKIIMKVDKVVKKETLTIGKGILVCSVITQLAFLIFRQYSLSVFLGSIYGGLVALLNFFLLGLTVQNVAKIEDPNMAKKKMQFSYSQRQLGLLLLVGLGMYIARNYEIFHWLPILLAIFYPRITIFILGFFNKEYRRERGGIA